MEKSSYKWLKIMCVFALIFTIVWLVFYAIQTYFVLTTGSGPGVINWDATNIGLRLTMFIVNRLLIIAIGIIVIMFIKNILNHLKGGTIFNHRNVVLLWILAFVLPVHAFLSDNLQYSVSTDYNPPLLLTDTPFVYLIVSVIVAMLYKVAYDAAEEQKLTI